MLEIFDVVIATVAVILGLSLIVQAIQQIFKQACDLKSKYMRTELLALFEEPKKVFNLLNNFQPLGRLSRNASEFSKRIVTELEDKLRSYGFTDLHLVEEINREKLKEILKEIPLAKDKTLVDKFNDALEQVDRWFDISKRAFQEHYERRMKYWAFVISAVVVIVTNANIVQIFQELNQNKQIREGIIAAAPGLISQVVQTSISPEIQFTDAQRDSIIKSKVKIIQDLVSGKSFNLIRLNIAGGDSILLNNVPKYLISATRKNIIGWLIMTLLVSLGAPFWYDFLKMIMGIKNTFKKDKPTE